MAPDPTRRATLVAGGLVLGGLAAGGLTGLTGCAGRGVPPTGPLVLGTGPAGAVFREFGAAVRDLWNAEFGREVVTPRATGAAVENAALLAAGEIDVGLVNVDVGAGVLASTAADPAAQLRALARVFDSVFHVVVPQDSSARRLADLDGARVSLGENGSGSRFVADRLLQALGVAVEPVALSQDAGARALAAGALDAVISLTAMPTPALTWLLQESGTGVRLLPLEEETTALERAHPGEYLRTTISSAVYPGVASTVAPAVPTLLAVRADLGRDVAAFLTRTLLEGSRRLATTRPEARQLNRRTAVATVPVPLHPGAADWFASVKT